MEKSFNFLWGCSWYLQADVFRLAGHYPAGGSANTMAHFFQNYNSGTSLLYKLHLSFFQSGIRLISLGESFLYFDYGPADNLIRYGTTYPPEYNLTQVTVPVYLVHADNDPFAPNEVGRANNSIPLVKI